MHTQKKF